MTQTFLNTLDLTPEEQEQFLASIAETHRARAPIRLGRGFKRVKAQPVRTTELSIDTYRVIADWYHAAIMELTFTNGFDSSPKAIAQELGITELEASLAIDRLIRLELMESRNGRLVKTNLQLSTADKHLTTPALRKNQRQFLEKAIESLEDAPIERRSMTSMTMAVNESKMPEAKQLIREFNRKLCSLLESGKRGRVYNLSIALYPLQKEQE
ncbi:MAG: hypothetical protein A2Z97_12415 [Bdellovibrionales bacterium GWB1_52_6]|nr:MAG: hypothetical protein A2Z97_12415 [Bdellovibrionales bacterium GWB1_52_6]OFZ03742.1 MAG: hypothetical protein A2X97_14395 [Bdellovibrionales bacterium GWA1_52_35]